MIVAKDYIIIQTKQNNTTAQLSGLQHKIIRFSLSVFNRTQENTILSDMEYFENDFICPEASNVML